MDGFTSQHYQPGEFLPNKFILLFTYQSQSYTHNSLYTSIVLDNRYMYMITDHGNNIWTVMCR